MEIPSNWTLNAGDGARQLVKGMLVRQRLKTEEGWKYKLYAVAKVGEGSVTLVPVMVGGWSDSASGAVNVSPMSEVEYRLDEGAPYSEERYGATAAKGAPYRVREVVNREGETRVFTAVGDSTQEQPPSDNEEAEPEERKEPEMATSETVTKVAAAPVVRRPIVKKPAPAKAPAAATVPAETKVMRTGAAKPKAAKTTAPARSPLSARGGKDPGTAARVAARRAKSEIDSTVMRAEPVETASAYPYTLAEAANLAGVNANRVNAYRRAGLLPKRGGFETQGRAVMYSQKAVDAILKLEEKGTRIPAPTRGASATAAKGAKRGRRGAKSTAQYGALGQAIAEAEALAAKYQERANKLKALAADEG